MANEYLYVVSLGRFSTSLSLEAQLIGVDGSLIGDAVFMTELGNGRYYFSIEHIFNGAVVITDTERGKVVQVGAINSINRWWVNDSGDNDWSNPNNWALAEGGIGGVGVPSLINNAYFSNTSSSDHCTLSTNSECKNLYGVAEFSGGSDDYTGNFNANDFDIQIYENIKLSSNITLGNGTWEVGGNVDFRDAAIIANESEFIINGEFWGGSQSFYNITCESDIIFQDSFSITNLLKAITPSIVLSWESGASYEINDIELDGQSEGTEIILIPSSTTQYNWKVSTTPQRGVSYVAVSYCNAISGQLVIAYDGTNINNGVNINWLFTEPSSASYDPGGYDLGYWGNSAIILYNPSADDHPSLSIADAIANNLFYCNDFNLFPEYEANIDNDFINGFPDRNIFVVKPIVIQGEINQKMLARMDDSPDYVLARLYEHTRHAWAGYQYTEENDGSGVQGIPGSQFIPQFAILSDIHGVYSRCLVNSIEFSAKVNEQVDVNYGIVAQKIWTEDVPIIRSYMSNIASSIDANTAMRQVFSDSCGLIVDNSTYGTPVAGAFDIPSGGSNQLFKGYNTPDTFKPQEITEMSFKIENFLKPNYAMQSEIRWGDDREERDISAYSRVRENLWPRNFYQEKQRLISGSITWITDTQPIHIIQRIAGGQSNQILYNSEVLGEGILLVFGPMRIYIQNPIWSFGKPELLPDKLFKITTKFYGASDGELLSPTKEWGAIDWTDVI